MTVNRLTPRNWKSGIPAWPRVPPLLWLTAAGVELTTLSRVFRAEIWTQPRPAELGSWTVLGVRLQAGGVQLINLLLRWPNGYQGTGWGQLVLRAATLVAGIGIAILLLLLFAAGGAAALARLVT